MKLNVIMCIGIIETSRIECEVESKGNWNEPFSGMCVRWWTPFLCLSSGESGSVLVLVQKKVI